VVIKNVSAEKVSEFLGCVNNVFSVGVKSDDPATGHAFYHDFIVPDFLKKVSEFIFSVIPGFVWLRKPLTGAFLNLFRLNSRKNWLEQRYDFVTYP
jgi:hypothetical protein